MRKVTGVKAVGSTVLLEMLSPEEAAGSHLVTTGKSQQGRILEIGPLVEADKWGLKVGNRVLLQGVFVPVPTFPGGDQRELVVVDPHMIKCVFEEGCEKVKCCKN
jgi:hypothetical protein